MPQSKIVDIRWDVLLSERVLEDVPGEYTLSLGSLLDLLEIGKARKMNAFRLLSAANGKLKQAGVRLTVLGADLRKAEESYGLGNDRVYAFLPIAKMERLEIGAPLGGRPELDIYLSEEYSDFLELGDFYLEKRYGFKSVEKEKFDKAFGAKVKKGPFSFSLSYIETIESPHASANPNYIAIHVGGFPKPKRWSITPIYSK